MFRLVSFNMDIYTRFRNCSGMNIGEPLQPMLLGYSLDCDFAESLILALK